MDVYRPKTLPQTYSPFEMGALCLAIFYLLAFQLSLIGLVHASTQLPKSKQDTSLEPTNQDLTWKAPNYDQTDKDSKKN